MEEYGASHVLIKRHPRDTTPMRSDWNYFDGNEIPFEVLCDNMDISRKILITAASTAVATPKVLMNKEPFVIVLCKIIKPFSVGPSKQIEYYEAIKDMYSNPDNFVIPDSIEEVYSAIQRGKAFLKQ